MDRVVDAVVFALFVGFIFFIAKGYVKQVIQRQAEKNSRNTKNS